MTKREFLDTVFALAPNEANKIMDAFDEYVDSNEPHWIPVTERPPEVGRSVMISVGTIYAAEGCLREDGDWCQFRWDAKITRDKVTAWRELPEPHKEEE